MKVWTDEQINWYLDSKRLNYSILIENELSDLNCGNIVRSSNVFLAKQIIIFGRRRYDRRSTCGMHRYQKIVYAPDIPALRGVLEELGTPKIVGMEIPGSHNLKNYRWDYNRHTVICVGHEGQGLDKNLIDLCDDLVYCPQMGACRSLNTSVAAGIFMYDYVSKINVDRD